MRLSNRDAAQAGGRVCHALSHGPAFHPVAQCDCGRGRTRIRAAHIGKPASRPYGPDYGSQRSRRLYIRAPCSGRKAATRLADMRGASSTPASHTSLRTYADLVA
jgi:hypothetical protein